MDHLFPTKQESPGPLKEFFSEKLNLGNSLNLDFVFDSIKSSDNVVFSLSATSLQQLAELLGDAERAYRGFNFPIALKMDAEQLVPRPLSSTAPMGLWLLYFKRWQANRHWVNCHCSSAAFLIFFYLKCRSDFPQITEQLFCEFLEKLTFT